MITILIVEDDAQTREAMVKIMETLGPAENKYNIVAIADGNEAWAFIQECEDPLFVSLDWKVPGLDGLQLLARIKERQKEDKFVYPGMITGAVRNEIVREQKEILGDDAQVTEAAIVEKINKFVDAGAKFVLQKPLDSAQLAQLFTQLRLFNDAYERYRSRENRRKRDPLTGLYNQVQCIDRLREEMERVKRSREGLAFIFIDLDRFKSINDTYGHGFGTEVLKIAARRIWDNKRPYDTAARYGGEEFCLILPEVGSREAMDMAERIREQISEPIQIGGKTIRITASLGVAMLCVHDLSPEDLIERADKAMYRVKESGRNGVKMG